MFKYALLLVVALCAVQGFEARIVKLDDPSIKDVVNGIKEITQKIWDAIANIPEVIQNIQDKIKEIIENINLPGLIAEIEEEIEKIIAVGEAGQKCVEAEREQIDDLIQNAQAGMDACVATAQYETAAVKDQLTALKDKANEVGKYNYARMVKCVLAHNQYFIALNNCLKELVAPVNEEYDKMQQEIQNTITNVKEIAEQVGDNLASCVEKVRDETVAKEQEIFSSIKKCVAGSV